MILGFFVLVFIVPCIDVWTDDSFGESEASGHKHMYSRVYNERMAEIEQAVSDYMPAKGKNCSCYAGVIDEDLGPFRATGVTRQMLAEAGSMGTGYRLIGGVLFRDKRCLFPARCSGVEHFLLKLAAVLPDLQLVLNTRDWPQVSKYHNKLLPVFSFSKTKEYYDIMYPTWSFWEGGPAIKLYPKGLGRWDLHRTRLSAVADEYPWQKKRPVVFFRGSRTSSERDALVLLSRENPQLVDAAYTKNQAWKSDKDTLDASPAEEVSLDDHCKYRYLFNFRGVAASFRLKHLFLCGSLVFHVGHEWLEFFYAGLRPWVHYVPVPKDATKHQIKELIEFFREHDDMANAMAERGRKFVLKHLRMKDVTCYWRTLLVEYSTLLTFQPELDSTLIRISKEPV